MGRYEYYDGVIWNVLCQVSASLVKVICKFQYCVTIVKLSLSYNLCMHGDAGVCLYVCMYVLKGREGERERERGGGGGGGLGRKEGGWSFYPEQSHASTHLCHKHCLHPCLLFLSFVHYRLLCFAQRHQQWCISTGKLWHISCAFNITEEVLIYKNS